MVIFKSINKAKEYEKIVLPNNKWDYIFFGGSEKLLLGGSNTLAMLDIQERRIEAEVKLLGVRDSIWSDDMTHLALLSKTSVTLCNNELKILANFQDISNNVKSGVWDASGIFVYSTANNLKYALISGETGNLLELEEPMYVVKVDGVEVLCLDGDSQQKILNIKATEFRFLLGLLTGNHEYVMIMVKVAAEEDQLLMEYFERKGRKDLALKFEKYIHDRFELNVAPRGDLTLAYEAAKCVSKKEYWNELVREAEFRGDSQLVEKIYRHTKDYAKLILLFYKTGSVKKLKLMKKMCIILKNNLLHYHTELLLKDLEKRLRPLANPLGGSVTRNGTSPISNHLLNQIPAPSASALVQSPNILPALPREEEALGIGSASDSTSLSCADVITALHNLSFGRSDSSSSSSSSDSGQLLQSLQGTDGTGSILDVDGTGHGNNNYVFDETESFDGNSEVSMSLFEKSDISEVVTEMDVGSATSSGFGSGSGSGSGAHINSNRSTNISPSPALAVPPGGLADPLRCSSLEGMNFKCKLILTRLDAHHPALQRVQVPQRGGGTKSFPNSPVVITIGSSDEDDDGDDGDDDDDGDGKEGDGGEEDEDDHDKDDDNTDEDEDDDSDDEDDDNDGQPAARANNKPPTKKKKVTFAAGAVVKQNLGGANRRYRPPTSTQLLGSYGGVQIQNTNPDNFVKCPKECGRCAEVGSCALEIITKQWISQNLVNSKLESVDRGALNVKFRLDMNKSGFSKLYRRKKFFAIIQNLTDWDHPGTGKEFERSWNCRANSRQCRLNFITFSESACEDIGITQKEEEDKFGRYKRRRIFGPAKLRMKDWWFKSKM